MLKTKVHQLEDSQLVELPKEFVLKSDEVYIFQRDGDIIIREIPQNLARAYDLLRSMPDDFFA